MWSEGESVWYLWFRKRSTLQTFLGHLGTGIVFILKELPIGHYNTYDPFLCLGQLELLVLLVPGSRVGAVVRALASHQCGPGFNSRTRRHMWVEFVIGSLLCSKRFFSRYSGFPLSLKPTFPNSDSILECTDISEPVLVNSLVLRG